MIAFVDVVVSFFDLLHKFFVVVCLFVCLFYFFEIRKHIDVACVFFLLFSTAVTRGETTKTAQIYRERWRDLVGVSMRHLA